MVREDVLGDLWVLSLSNHTFRDVGMSEQDDGRRFDHDMTMTDDVLVLLYGRLGSERYPVFDVGFEMGVDDTQCWRWINCSRPGQGAGGPACSQPLARGGLRVTTIDPIAREAVFFGGECHLSSNLGLAFKDTWSLKVSADGPNYVSWAVLSGASYPTQRFSQTATLVGPDASELLVFGGLSPVSGFLNDVWSLELGSRQPQWRQVPTFGTPPSPRADHSAVLVPGSSSSSVQGPAGAESYLVIFGGRNSVPSLNLLADAVLLTYVSNAWVGIKAIGTAPAVAGHTAVLFRPPHAMVVFGGAYEVAAGGGIAHTNKLWLATLDIRLASSPTSTPSVLWQSISAISPPPPRAHHSAVMLRDAPSSELAMVIFGGQTINSTLDAPLGDTWILYLDKNMTKGEWAEISVSGSSPPARWGHAAAVLSDLRFLICGGWFHFSIFAWARHGDGC